MVVEHDLGAVLADARGEMRRCRRCPELVAARSRVVCGTGAPDARLLIVADAPRAGEDANDEPLAGRARALLDRLLLEAGCPPEDRYLTTLVRCRPPDARTPTAAEVAACAEHLETEVGIVAPRVVVALGGLVAGVLRGGPTSIRRARGREEPCRLGAHAVWLLPVFHPAAALYDPAAVPALAADLARLPELLERERPVIELDTEPERPPVDTGPGQLGLF